MAWRVAKSLLKFRRQINNKYPKRNKASDGTIGDARHKKNKSDHNPNSLGVVTAFDLTHDKKNGVDCGEIAKKLFDSKDKRIKYIIWNGKITIKGLTGWKKYTGSNKHSTHLHLSVGGNYDDDSNWKI